MIIECQGLSKTFSRQGKEFAAVDQVDFQLARGEFAVVTGQSGSGKSTFFNLLTGILKATRGKIFFAGQELTNSSARAWASLRASKISYVLQGHSLLDNLTVKDNICLPQALTQASYNLEDEAVTLLRDFGLGHMLNEYPGNLSYGERRRVSLIRAFVHQPSLVIADEPTSDLDPANAKLVMDFLAQKAKEGIAILISSHQLDILGPGLSHYEMDQGHLRRLERN